MSFQSCRKRFVDTSERLKLGLDGIAKSLESNTSSDIGLRKFVQEQVQHLRVDMIRCEEIAVENRKTHELNMTLREQLKAQQRHSSQLEEKIQTFQKSEATLRARFNQMERSLDDLREAHNPQSNTPELGQENVDLHEQLRNAKEDLDTANVETERNKQLQQCLEQDRARYKVYSTAILTDAWF